MRVRTHSAILAYTLMHTVVWRRVPATPDTHNHVDVVARWWKLNLRAGRNPTHRFMQLPEPDRIGPTRRSGVLGGLFPATIPIAYDFDTVRNIALELL